MDAVFGFQDIDKTKLNLVGGKGANLGELTKINGILVPEGFCVTTEAYKEIIEDNPTIFSMNYIINSYPLIYSQGNRAQK